MRAAQGDQTLLARKLAREAQHIAGRMKNVALRLPAALSHTHATAQRSARDDRDFWQFRSYQPGDAVRLIDWKKTARGEDVLVRERQRHDQTALTLWLDPGPAMAFHQRQHRAIVMSLVLALLMARDGGHVLPLGFGAFKNVDALAHHLLHNPMPDLATLPPKTGPNGPLLIITDGWSLDAPACARLAALRTRHSRIILLQLIDPAKRTLPYRGHVRFVADTDPDPVTIQSADAIRAAYQQRIEQHIALLAHACQAHGIIHIDAMTDDDPGELAQRCLTDLGPTHARA